MRIRPAVLGAFRELHDVSHLQVAVLYALDGVAVAALAVAQVGGGVAVLPGGSTQRVIHGLVVHTGGHVAVVGPNPVLGGVGEVILVQGQGCGFRGVDGSLGNRCGKGGGDTTHDQAQCQQQGQNTSGFHCCFSS